MGTGTQLGRVRGLGAARSGAKHWWRHRVSAVAGFALLAWFVISLLRLPDLDHETVVTWLKQPLVAVPMLLLIAAVFAHFRMGVQVMIEDYVHTEGSKLLALMALDLYVVAGAVTAAFCVLKIAFGA